MLPLTAGLGRFGMRFGDFTVVLLTVLFFSADCDMRKQNLLYQDVYPHIKAQCKTGNGESVTVPTTLNRLKFVEKE